MKQKSPLSFISLSLNSSHVAAGVAALARFYAPQGAMREGNFGQLLTEKARGRLGNYLRSTARLTPVAAQFDQWNRRYRATPIIRRPDPLGATDYFIAGLQAKLSCPDTSNSRTD